MMNTASHALASVCRRLLKSRDRFWSGVWWTEWKLRHNERRLALALEKFGEDAMLVRGLTERHRRLAKGLKYWRPSDPLVMLVLEACERAGVPRSELRVMALNRDIFRVGKTVKVRWSRMLNVCAWATLCVVVICWMMLVALVIFSAAGAMQKILGAAAITLFYWMTWPGLGLYTTRAMGAVKNVGRTVETIAAQQMTGSATVSSIRAHNGL